MMNDRIIGRKNRLNPQRLGVEPSDDLKKTHDRTGKTINVYFPAVSLATLDELNEVVRLLGISRGEYIIDLIRKSLTSA